MTAGPRGLTLRVCRPDGVEDTVTSNAAEIIIGRRGDTQPDVDLSPDPGVSRRHARVFRSEEQWLVEDLGSRNGTLLDDRPVSLPMPVTSGSVLHVGAHLVRIDLSLTGCDLVTEEGAGSITGDVLSQETIPPAGMREDDLLSTLARLQEVVAYAQSPADMLDGALRQVRDGFPAAARAGIVLVENGELVVRAFWPRPAAATSFTLARRTIDSEHALLWRSTPGTAPSSPSLSTTASALYAPMLRARRAVGAVHLDSVSTTRPFATGDLARLAVMANIIGAIDMPAAPFPRLPGIFVSYAHADGEFVHRLVGDLRRRQIRVWFDERLRSGEGWRQQLRTAIGASDALLLVLSPASAISEYVQWEIGVAADLDKPLVPVVYQPCQPPEAVQELQYISLEKDYAAGLHNLRERFMPLREGAT